MLATKPLGKTGLTVTRLGLGMAALGRPGYINLGHSADLEENYDVATMEARARTVLDAAWAAGVRYFDTARSYGRGEEFLGRWLEARGIKPAEVVIGSKWGYTYTAGWSTTAAAHEVKDHTLPTFRRQFAESQSILGAQLDLYQIHSATLESGVLDDAEVLRALVEVKSQGIPIGLSVSGPRQAETIAKALEACVDGERVFDCVQATYNVLETSASPALAEASAAGLGVIIKEGLANGRLTARNVQDALLRSRNVLERQAERLKTSIDALALAAILYQPWVDTVLSGAATTEHLHSNLAAAQVVWDAECATALASLTEPRDQYWSTRSQLPWN
ncbi:MAG: aldo/keto reductase [Isosphaeraceae bacterium]